MPVRLNFGCGSIQPAGWVNVDRQDFGQQYVGEVGDCFCDGEMDLIVAHCALQMNTYDEIPGLLGTLHRILKSGGVLRVSLPDVVAGFCAYQRRDREWFPNGEPDLDQRFSNWLTWYSTTRSLWTRTAIIDQLFAAGFLDVARCGFGESCVDDGADLDTRVGECFFIEAVK